MADKTVYKVGVIANEQDDFTNNIPLVLNRKCYQLLRKQKDLISQYNLTKKWDKYKKFMNNYELVFTSSNGFPNISQYAPISRSFFKMWEILHDFKDELPQGLSDPNLYFKSCSVAEGPGGFIEAIVKYRKEVVKALPCQSSYFGMTLISPNKNIPNWKLSSEFISENRVTLCYGEDGTGSLYKMSNVEKLCTLSGECDLVTGDGGFDYSNDFNEQEEASLPLLLCETLVAIKIQRTGGAFILKIFDISQGQMFQLLYILHQVYGNVYITKPFSSRPANSEKYLVCTDFKGRQQHYESLLTSAITDGLKQLITVPICFLKDIVFYNTHYTAQQIVSIAQTIKFIDACEDSQESSNDILQTLKKQIECALRWCYKYKLPVSKASLDAYKHLLQSKCKHTCSSCTFDNCKVFQKEFYLV